MLPVSRFGKVAVLMGGWSAERPVSLKSGEAVLLALKAAGVDAHGIDAGPDVLDVLGAGSFNRAFVVLHGRGGEDGVIQGALELLGLPYTGSGVAASALGMNKLWCKRIWRDMGLPTAQFVVLQKDSHAAAVCRELGLPLIVKPALEGSSIGMTVVRSEAELASAYQLATDCGGPVLAETWLPGAEYTVAVVDGEALPAIRLETPHEFYDYDAKYHANDTQYYCPCGLEVAAEQALQQLCIQAFEAIGCTGWGRVDVRMDAQGQASLIEVNTVPGMTDHSLVPKAAAAAGMDLSQLVLRILASTLTDEERKCSA